MPFNHLGVRAPLLPLEHKVRGKNQECKARLDNAFIRADIEIHPSAHAADDLSMACGGVVRRGHLPPRASIAMLWILWGRNHGLNLVRVGAL